MASEVFHTAFSLRASRLCVVTDTPSARILVADETNFTLAKRARFLSRAATATWDAIIITHSAFRFIGVPSAFEQQMIQDELELFETLLTKVESDGSARGPEGFDRVEFWVETNPGTRPGPMMKVASGGELSRFMLALKVVLGPVVSSV